LRFVNSIAHGNANIVAARTSATLKLRLSNEKKEERVGWGGGEGKGRQGQHYYKGKLRGGMDLSGKFVSLSILTAVSLAGNLLCGSLARDGGTRGFSENGFNVSSSSRGVGRETCRERLVGN
jgi:hypothetical protein